MKTKNIILFLFYFLICSEVSSSQKIISKPHANNPTSYIFKIKIANAPFVLEKSLNKYSSINLHVHDIYYQSPSKPLRWWPEIAKRALSGEDKIHDVYMQVSVDTSYIYSNKQGKPLAYEMQCTAHFMAIDDSTTKMEIKVLNAKVYLRNKLLPSPPHFVNNPVYKNVLPTTIEEYKILRCFGKTLGIIDQMPALKVQ